MSATTAPDTPDGLAGESIPLVSRIVSVCDAYDAMTHERAYRPARSSREAVAELRKHSSTQFDAKVVEAFVNSLEASRSPLCPKPDKASATL